MLFVPCGSENHDMRPQGLFIWQPKGEIAILEIAETSKIHAYCSFELLECNIIKIRIKYSHKLVNYF